MHYMKNTVCGKSSNIPQVSAAMHFAVVFLDLLPSLVYWARAHKKYVK